jgi:DNA-binding transcriptional LysR family regulator
MEMYQVRYFLSVVRTLNFTRAADECDVAQPSLSRAIKQLEAELDGELFRRERPQAILTELGHRMLPILSRCYESANSAKAVAAAVRKGEAGALRIALSHSIDFGLLVSHIRELNRTFDVLVVVVRRGSAAEALEFLRAGGTEVALAAADEAETQSHERFPLFDEDFLLRCGRTHRMADRPGLSLADLRDERFILPRHGEHIESLAAWLRKAKIDLERCHETDSDADMMKLVADGLGVAVAPRSAPLCDGVVSTPVEGLDLRRTVCAFGAKGRPRTPSASMLINLLRAADWTGTRAG